jgi:hypothetical membrane protein
MIHRFRLERLAAGLWGAAGVLYLASEAAAAFAFVPRYSYRDDFISDLGVPTCAATCSPLHALMNWDFALQGGLFLGAALAVAGSLTTPARFGLIALAALNGIGNVLIGMFPETDPAELPLHLRVHVAGAFLAIVFGNATALLSAWAFRELGLARIHRFASLTMPPIAAVALTMLAVRSASNPVPDGVLERISVYSITVWELLSAACIMRKTHVVPLS